MKKIVLMGVCGAVCCATGWAQKAYVTSAQNSAMMGVELDKAKEKIEQAIVHPETKDQAKTWFVAGQVSDALLNAEIKKQFSGDDDKDVRGQSVSDAYLYFIKAHDLDMKPDAKGVVKPKYTRQIVSKVRTYPAELRMYGAKQYMDEDYNGAFQTFSLIAALPELDFMKNEVNAKDSIYLEAAYYAADAALKAGKKESAIALYERVKDDYEQDKCYQQLAILYKDVKGDAEYLKYLESSYASHPDNTFMLYSLINEYVMVGRSADAKKLLAEAMKKNPNDVDLIFLNANLNMKDENYDEAVKGYEAVLQKDPKHKGANESLGDYHYIVVGKEFEKKADEAKDFKQRKALNEKAEAEYRLALPYYETVKEVQPEDKNCLRKLMQLYYKLKMDDKFNEVDKLIKSL